MKNPRRWYAISEGKKKGLIFRSPFALDTYLSFDTTAERYMRIDFILRCESDRIPIYIRDGKDVGSEKIAEKGVDY